MNHLTQPVAPHLTVMINNAPVGALQFYSEKTVRRVETMRSLGSSENKGFYFGEQEHSIRLRYLMPPASLMTELVPDPHSLHGFQLRINTPDRAICFSPCEFFSVETSCEIGGGIVCEASICALHRTIEEMR